MERRSPTSATTASSHVSTSRWWQRTAPRRRRRCASATAPRRTSSSPRSHGSFAPEGGAALLLQEGGGSALDERRNEVHRRPERIGAVFVALRARVHGGSVRVHGARVRSPLRIIEPAQWPVADSTLSHLHGVLRGTMPKPAMLASALRTHHVDP